LLDFYRNILTEPQLLWSNAINKITCHIPCQVNAKKNNRLIHTISFEEVEQAIKSIPTSKSLGPDDFTTNFFHHCWNIIKDDI
jgi:hypothetical protein